MLYHMCFDVNNVSRVYDVYDEKVADHDLLAVAAVYDVCHEYDV